MVRNIKLTISYDGTNYHGWQTQLNAVTIQETIECAIEAITKQKVDLTASGRTDRGVHALGQVANFISDNNIPDEKIKIALNANLPQDIRIIDSLEVPLNFNSRFDAHDKTYMYQIYNDRVGDPFLRNYSYFVPQILDLDKMQQSAKLLRGTHDFKGFMAAGSQVKTTVRTIYDVYFEINGPLIRLYVKGNGFLYNMVRIIAGTLIDIGKGLKDKSCIEEALNKLNRNVLGQTAAAEGLFLKEVNYPDTERTKNEAYNIM